MTESAANEWVFPFMLGRVYGGQIMAQSIGAAYEILDDTFELVSFTTLFLLPVETADGIEYSAEIQGGGHTIKYINVHAMQGNARATTYCIFSRKESTAYALERAAVGPLAPAEAEDAPHFARHCTEHIAETEEMAADEAARKYKPMLRIIEYFTKAFDLRWVGHKARFSLSMGLGDWASSAKRLAMAVAYASDILLVECASLALNFPLHDPARMSATSLKHSVNYSVGLRRAETSKYTMSAACIMFRDGKAVIQGTVVDAQGELYCTLEQIVLLRDRRATVK